MEKEKRKREAKAQAFLATHYHILMWTKMDQKMHTQTKAKEEERKTNKQNKEAI